MKISFFIGGMYRGGAERVISILANYYAEKGWDVDIVLLLYSEVHYKLNENINIIDMAAGEGAYIKKVPRWIYNVRQYLAKYRPDRVVSFIGRINMVVLTASIGMKIPIIVSERNDPKHDGRGKLIQTYCNLIYKRAKSIVYQTEYEKSCFSKKLSRGCIIPNPVTVYSMPKDVNRLEIVTAGRLLPQKNQKMLIDAFNKVHEKYPESVLSIYGDGELKNELQGQIEKLGLTDSAKLCGNVLDLHERISGAAIFVLTSEFEGLSNALIEAMMLGIPCISTDYPGSEEIIDDGINGIIVSRNDVQALINAIISIIENKNKANDYRNNALNEAKNYSLDNVLKQWESVIG